jgi:glycerophosphoryl diester phosphodiesterase
MKYLDTDKPRVFGHRGASGRAPENTSPAFDAAIKAGAAILELDVHGTRDGEIVVLHDAELDRTTDGCGPVRARSLDEVRTLDAGAKFEDAAGARPFAGCGVRVPTLDEVLDRYRATPLNIEIKQGDPQIEDAVFAKLDEHGARDRVLLAAESQEILTRIREGADGMLTGSSADEALDFYNRFQEGALAGYEAAGFALQVPHFYEGIEVVTESFVAAAHGAGMEVHVWTINDPSEMHELLDRGIDGLMSDFPERIVEVLAERGRRD